MAAMIFTTLFWLIGFRQYYRWKIGKDKKLADYKKKKKKKKS